MAGGARGGLPRAQSSARLGYPRRSLYDGVSAEPRHNVSIVGRDDKILQVETGFSAPVGAEVIDLSTPL